MPRRLRIFVHCASECLTDHLPHGDGLICFSLLAGLAHRGHRIEALAWHADISTPVEGLEVATILPVARSGALRIREFHFRANRRYRRRARSTAFDLVWRMHPYGYACPGPPATSGEPLVIGPLFYPWPQPARAPQRLRWLRPGTYLMPSALRGWDRALATANALLLPTAPMQADYQARFPNACCISVPVIVDPPAPPPERSAAANEPLRLVFVANLVDYKNPAIFLDAVQLLHQRGIPLHAEIAGDGPLRGHLEARIEQLGLGSAVRMLGRIPNRQVFDLVARAHFMVSASLGEPYGRNIAEAMSVGTPCVCHRSGGPADFILDQRNGLLVPDLAAALYAEQIAAVWQTPGRWSQLSRGATETAAAWRARPVLDHLEAQLLHLAHGPNDS